MVLPSLADITNNWGNASLLAFWERLFDQPTDTITPVVHSPLLLKLTVWSSWLALTALVTYAVWKTRFVKFSDQSFAMTVVAMLLMTPTTWHHYFIILLVPVGILLKDYPPYSGKRWLVNLTVAALAISPRLVWALLIPAQKTITSATASAPWQQGGMVAVPWQSLTALSYQCFALLFLIALLWPDQFPSRQTTRDSPENAV